MAIGLAGVLAAGAAWWTGLASSGEGGLGLIATSVGEGEVEISLRALAEAGPVVTVIGTLEYDAARLRLTGCRSDAGSPGKQLQVRELEPGVARAVLAGSLEPLPAGSQVMNCRFAVAAAGGTTVVRAHGEVADLSFEDRPFRLEQSVRLGS